VYKVIRQKAALPTCHPSRIRMDSSDLDPIWYMVTWIHMSQPPNSTSIGPVVFQSSTVCQTHRHTSPTCETCRNKPHLCWQCDAT